MYLTLRVKPSGWARAKGRTRYTDSLVTAGVCRSRGAICGDCAGIDRQQPQGSEEFPLRGEAKARQGRLRIYIINSGKAQAPSSDQIPARNTPIHQPTPYDGANCPLL